MEMVVDQTRHDHIVGRPDNLFVGITGAEVLVAANLYDLAVLL